jgi:hypothetical protein
MPSTRYADREENVGYEVRAGLDSFYRTKGYVADDLVHPSCLFTSRSTSQADGSLK